LAEKKYESERQKHPDTIEGHMAMAEWCGKNGLPGQREKHLRAALTLDADFEPALDALGYVRVGDAWIKAREPASAPGEGREKAGSQEAKEPDQALRAAVAGWFVQVRAIYSAHFVAGRRLAADDSVMTGMEKILAIRDPLAIPAITEVLAGRYLILRKILVEALGRFREDEAAINLIMIALLDPSEEVRREANLRLLKRNDPRVEAQLREALRSEDETAVVNAATSLALIKARDAVPDLIKVLRRDGKKSEQLGLEAFLAGMMKRFGIPRNVKVGDREVAYQPGIGVMGADSPVVWSGQRTSQSAYRSEVQEALIEITGVNHGFDKDAWMLWYLQNSK
jgi:hypothetical protein